MFIIFTFQRSYAQNIDLQFRKITYCIIYSFKKINENKYEDIAGIRIVSDTTGKLIDFTINFRNDKNQLNQSEYFWFFNKLKKYNYSFLKHYYSVLELENTVELRGRVKYSIKNLKECNCE